MKLLEDRILSEGRVLAGDILDVDRFLNHQMDIALLDQIGAEFFRLYGDAGVNKILTIESSGIAIACVAAMHFGKVPVVFAKKHHSANIVSDYYTAPVLSYTHGSLNNIIVSTECLGPQDRVLVIDDYLARGEALKGLFSICIQAKATLLGAGICVEKVYQGGGEKLRQLGYRIESLAKISSLSLRDGVHFSDNYEHK